MFLPPIIEREMRTALRSHGTWKARWWIALVAAAATAFCLLISLGFGASVFRAFHKYLFAAGIYLAVVRPCQHAAGLFAEERRNQTLGLIYLTGISSLELFVTKFLGGLLVASSELIALVPFIALPFFTGGVSLDLFLATAASLPTLLIFAMSLTTVVSILSTDESQALAWIGVGIALMSLAVPLAYSLGVMVAGTAPFDARWLCLSPAYGPYLVFMDLGTGGPGPFWLATSITWIWSVLFFVSAGWLLHRNWREDPDADLWASLKSKYGVWLGRFRETERLRVVRAMNPFQWQVEHDRRSISAAWISCGAIIALWLLGWAVWRERWPLPPNLYATAFLLAMLVDMFQRHAPARQMASHRRDGIFEVLLTTPLQPAQIVEGEVEGLTAQFRPLRRALCGVFVAMSLIGLFTRPWTWRALTTYSIVWGFLILWAGSQRRRSLFSVMWIALNSGRSSYALTGPRGNAWVWIFNIYNFRRAFQGFGSRKITFPTGSETEFTVSWVVALLVVVIVIVAAFERTPAKFRDRLIAQMRSIVQKPVPSPKDPASKNGTPQNHSQIKVAGFLCSGTRFRRDGRLAGCASLEF